MNHLVIDLEMCKVPRKCRGKEYKYALETIQIGAVLLDEDFRQIGTLSQYVHPDYGTIDYFIENLTGISTGNVKNAPRIQEALTHLVDWLGDREYKVYAWSSSDYDQLKHEFRAKSIEAPELEAFMDPDRWIDYQDVFGKRYDFSRAISLEEALTRAEIEAEGRLHDGLDDAINTGKLIEKLEHNPDYQLNGYNVPQLTSESLGYSLGSLFAGLGLECA